jgi:hypothetical protein
MGGVMVRCFCAQWPMQMAVDPLMQILHLSLKSMSAWLPPPIWGHALHLGAVKHL